jgi:type I restriction enzyme S subunit
MIRHIIKSSEATGGRFDPHQFRQERIEAIKKIRSIHEYCKLKDIVCNVKQITTELSTTDIYIGLENIESNTGDYVVTKEKETISSAGVFNKGDILFPKLRPYLNKVYLAKFKGKCSTEFHVFQAKNINPEFLVIILRSNLILNQTKYLMTGNTLPRLQTSDIENLFIPLPTRKVQQQIVDLYNRAVEKKQAKEWEAATLLADIDNYLLKELGIKLPPKDITIQGRFYEVDVTCLIGRRYDPYYHQPHFEKAFSEIEKTQYPIKTLKEISVLITSGITPLAGGDAYTSSSEGIPFVRSGDIDINGDIDFEKLLYLKPSVHGGIMKSSRLIKNDILIAIVGATIGQVGIYKYECDANINQAIALVRLKDEISFDYVKEYIKSSIGQLNLDRLKRPVARANINLEEISSIEVILPPIGKQNEIAKYIQSVRTKAKQLQEEAKEVLEKVKIEIEKMIIGE